MSTGSDLIALIASRQNLADYQKKHWTGIVRRVPRHRPARPQGDPHRLPAALRHDPRATGPRRSIVNKEKVLRYKFFEDPDNGGQDAIFGLERTLIEPGQHPQERRAPATAPSGACCSCTGRSAAPRARSPGCSRRGWSATRRPTRARSTPTAGARTALDGDETYADCPMHEEPLHLIPLEHRAELVADSERRDRPPRLPDRDRGGPLPVLPPDVQRADGAVRRRLGAGRSRTSGSAA